MNVSEFINTLKNNPEKTLNFTLENKFKVLPFIHITEIKNVEIESVDCGGQKNQWSETVMQLWTGVTKDDGHRVDSSKALGIIQKVDQISPLKLKNKLLIEYGDNEHVVAQYEVHLDAATRDDVYFKLNGVLSQCKEVKDEMQCCSSNSDCCA